MKLTYNSERPTLPMPEYGRHVQQMVEHCLTVEDREERNHVAMSIVNIMGQLFPHLRDVEDFRHKLWDHLHIMAGFQLDVDSPYPKPKPEKLMEDPRPLKYPHRNIAYGHYGKVVENMIEEAIKIEDKDKQNALVKTLANLMKRSYLTWNRDSVRDDVIKKDLEEMSGGKLTVDMEDLAPAQKLAPKVVENKNRGKRKRKKGGRKRRN